MRGSETTSLARRRSIRPGETTKRIVALIMAQEPSVTERAASLTLVLADEISPGLRYWKWNLLKLRRMARMIHLEYEE